MQLDHTLHHEPGLSVSTIVLAILYGCSEGAVFQEIPHVRRPRDPSYRMVVSCRNWCRKRYALMIYEIVLIRKLTMLDYIRQFEKIMYITLIILLGGVIVFSIAELVWLLGEGLLLPGTLYRLDMDELLGIFGFFLLVVIGIELLDTLKAYLRENVIHVEIVILVAVIAIARKVIILDMEVGDGCIDGRHGDPYHRSWYCLLPDKEGKFDHYEST